MLCCLYKNQVLPLFEIGQSVYAFPTSFLEKRWISHNYVCGLQLQFCFTIIKASATENHIYCKCSSVLVGVYFSCIMAMVASSVVTTIMILSFHHRKNSYSSMGTFVVYLICLFVSSTEKKIIQRENLVKLSK